MVRGTRGRRSERFDSHRLETLALGRAMLAGVLGLRAWAAALDDPLKGGYRASDKTTGAAAAIRWWNKVKVIGSIARDARSCSPPGSPGDAMPRPRRLLVPMLAFAVVPEEEGMPLVAEPSRTMWTGKSL